MVENGLDAGFWVFVGSGVNGHNAFSQRHLIHATFLVNATFWSQLPNGWSAGFVAW
jgi:Uri superfamily endonuclease